MSEGLQPLAAKPDRRRVLFVESIAAGDAVLMTFTDPKLTYAVVDGDSEASRSRASDTAPMDALDVLILQPSTNPSTADARTGQGTEEWSGKPNDAALPAAVFVKYRGVELSWRPGFAALQCAPEQAAQLLPALVEFAHYERELRRIEDELAAAWPDLDADKALAFEVTPKDLQRSEIVGGRMARTLDRRIRLARIEPHIPEPGARLSAAGYKMGEELREKAGIEARLEAIDGQLEVFEYIYEMASQRMGEFRGSRQEHFLEWIIIALLGAEALLVLLQLLLKRWL